MSLEDQELEVFDLTGGERASPMWRRISAWLEKRLHDARCHNDNTALTAEQTAALRGEIKALKTFIALGEEPPDLDGNHGDPRKRGA